MVIGILIALQINNWNEDRKSKLNEAVILKDLVDDLDSDHAAFQEQKKTLEKQLQLVDELLLDPNNSPLSKTNLNYIRYNVEIYPVTFDDNIPQGIYNSAILDNLKTYYRTQQTVLQDVRNYTNVIENLVRPFLRKYSIHNPETAIVDLAALGYTENEEFGKKLLDINKLAVHYDSDEFRQILFELRLKTAEFINDINTVCKANRELIPVIEDYIK